MAHHSGGRAAAARPTRTQLQQELKRMKRRQEHRSLVGTVAYRLVLVALALLLVGALLLPVLHINGNSMAPTLTGGQIVVGLRGSQADRGDLIAFYYNKKLLIKRVVALPGETVNLDEDGQVFINDLLTEEPYVAQLALGECDIPLPCVVPEGRVFVMGDNRLVSMDSRSESIGCVAEEQIMGRVVWRIWPLTDFGPVS